MWSRRDLLKNSLLALLLSQLGPGRARARLPTSRKRPRYYVAIVLGGGMDATYTTDPKVRAEVDPDIDLAYPPQKIIESGDVRFGPLMKDLTRWAPRMAVVNGVRVKTANHETGFRQILRFRTGVSPAMPGLFEIIGEQRDSQPLACLSLGNLGEEVYSPNQWFGIEMPTAATSPQEREKDLFDLLDDATPQELGMLAEVYRGHAGRLRRQSDTRAGRATVANIDQCASLFARLEKTPRFKEEKWSDDARTQANARCLQRTLWMLENDLTASVFFMASSAGSSSWDTHQHNLRRQTEQANHLFGVLQRFLTALSERSNAHGNLLKNTLIVAGSELGRFPKLNDTQGKDHFPEAPYFLIGSGVNTGSKGAMYGRTGRQMQALPIDLRTGQATSGATDFLTLDDLGATLLYSAGLEPATHDYTGRILDFLWSA